MRTYYHIILIALMVVMTGCQPRGESASLDQVVALAKSRYTQSLKQAAPQLSADVTQSVGRISQSLDAILSDASREAVVKHAKELETSLMALQYKVGYTSRPSLDELIKQYRFIAAGVSEGGQHAAAKLLASRTFHLMASELETTRFAL